MGTYKGSLKIAATADVIDAVFDVTDESLRVRTGNQVLGTWALPDVSAEPKPDGIHISLDGESVVVMVSDPEGFASALAPRRRRPKGRREKKRAQGRFRKRPLQQAVPEREPDEAVASGSVEVAAAEPSPPPPPPPSPEPVREHEVSAADLSTPEVDAMGPIVDAPPQVERIRRRRRPEIVSVLRRIPELFDPENWEEWLQDRQVRWSIASVAVIVLALLVLFAANTLGMILVLVGMVALIIAALVVSGDLSAYRAVPGSVSETTMVIAGAGAMIIGALLILIG